jgi:hypothetical protein
MEQNPPDPKGDDLSGERPAGRVRRDDSGNAVWEWVPQGDRPSSDSTSRLLRRLDVPGLRLEDDAPGENAASSGKSAERARVPGRSKEQGFDPYAGHASAAPKTKTRADPPPQPAKPVRKPSFLDRLLRRR